MHIQMKNQMKNEINCLRNQRKQKAQTKMKIQQIGMIRTNFKKY